MVGFDTTCISSNLSMRYYLWEEGCNFNVFTLICDELQDVQAAAATAQILHVCFNYSLVELAFFNSSCIKIYSSVALGNEVWPPVLSKTMDGCILGTGAPGVKRLLTFLDGQSNDYK